MISRIKARMKSRVGFTLVELLIVMVIIGILIAIAVPSYNTYVGDAKVTQAKGNLATMANAIRAYSADQGNGFFPTTGTAWTYKAGDIPAPGADISEVLQDANVTWTDASGGLTDPWGNPYTYTPYTDGNGNVVGFSITSPGPAPVTGKDDGKIYVSDSFFSAQVTSGKSLPSPLTGSGGTVGTTEMSN